MTKHSSPPFASAYSSLKVMLIAAAITHKQTRKNTLKQFLLYYSPAQTFTINRNYMDLQKQDIFKMALGVVLKTQQVIAPSALHRFPPGGVS